MENKLIEGDETNGGTITVNEEAAKNETVNQANFMQVADENGNFPPTPKAELTTNSQENINPNITVLDVSDEKPMTLEDLKKQQDDFVANKENQESAIVLANDIQQVMRGKWFTLKKAARKTGLEEIAVFQKLKLLELFGFLERKQGDPLVPEQRNEMVFRVVISLATRLQAIDDQIKVFQVKIDDLNLRRRSLIASHQSSEPEA